MLRYLACMNFQHLQILMYYLLSRTSFTIITELRTFEQTEFNINSKPFRMRALLTTLQSISLSCLLILAWKASRREPPVCSVHLVNQFQFFYPSDRALTMPDPTYQADLLPWWFLRVQVNQSHPSDSITPSEYVVFHDLLRCLPKIDDHLQNKEWTHHFTVNFSWQQ